MSMYIFNTYYTGKNKIKVITEYKEIKILIDAKNGTGTLTEITMRDFENEKKENTMTPQELSNEIKTALVKHGMSQKQFSERAGLQECVISDIINCKRKHVHFKTVSKILEAVKGLKNADN